MCFPSPGPRCSAHANAEYLTALKRFKGAKSMEERVKLGAILETKQQVFESTPRGLNRLRQEADLTEDSGLKFVLTHRMEVGQATRQRQLAEYNALRKSKSSAVHEALTTEGLTGRYQLAAGIAYAHLSEWGHSDVEIVDVHTIISISKAGTALRWFVLPQKYQDLWGDVSRQGARWEGDSKIVEFLEAQHGSLDHIMPEHLPLLQEWFSERLSAAGYTGVLLVDTRSERVSESSVTNLYRSRDIRLTLRQKLGGTTRWTGEEAQLRELLGGTAWEQGTLAKGEEGWVVSNVHQQPKRELHVNGIYLAWREASADFLVRRPHTSTKYSLVVKLAERS